jgi:hypothetical protein
MSMSCLQWIYVLPFYRYPNVATMLYLAQLSSVQLGTQALQPRQARAVS